MITEDIAAGKIRRIYCHKATNGVYSMAEVAAMTIHTVANPSARRMRLSLDVTPELHTSLKITAARRRVSMSELLRELLESSLVLLGEGSAAENLDSLAVRRELASVGVAALGDFWDNEVDAQWQTFQP
jgi:hypothetical protein